jgi:DNA replication protein DnaC
MIAEQIEKLMASIPRVSDEESDKWNWKHDLRPRVTATKLPKRFCRPLEWGGTPQFFVFEQCKSILTGTGAIVVLVGPRGVGKTTIAAQLIIERACDASLTPAARQPPYRKMSDVVALFKPLYSDYGSRNTEKLIQRREDYARFPLLVIDEIHECEEQKSKDRVMIDILDRRYAARNDTLLITNQTPREFEDDTDESIISRMREHGRIIECNWESFRVRPLEPALPF